MSSYVVQWQREDGQPGWHPVATVQEATAHVEHLRNHEGTEGARIYRLDEIAFEYKPYFRVELATAGVVPATSFAASITAEPEPPAAAAPPAEPAPPVEAVLEEVLAAAPSWPADEDDPEPEAVNGTGRRGLFGR